MKDERLLSWPRSKSTSADKRQSGLRPEQGLAWGLTAEARAAGVVVLRFHDSRHMAATRLVGAHMPIPEVGRVLGHTQTNMTARGYSLELAYTKFREPQVVTMSAGEFDG